MDTILQGFFIDVHNLVTEYFKIIAVFGVLALLIGIAGGAHLRIKDMEIRGLRIGARITAAIIGIVLIGTCIFDRIYFEEPPEIRRIRGNFFPVGKMQPSSIKIAFVPEMHSVLNEGSFVIDNIDVDKGYLIILKEESVYCQFIRVEKYDTELAIKVKDDSLFKINSRSIVDSLKNLYKDPTNYWEDRIDAIEQLGILIQKDEKVKDQFIKELEKKDLADKDKILATFAIAESGDSTRVKEGLKNLMNKYMNEKNYYNKFIGIRAAYYLMSSGYDKDSELAEMNLFEILNDSSTTTKFQHKTAAALFLSKHDRKQACVIENLVTGLIEFSSDPKLKRIRRELRDSLANLVGTEVPEDGDWDGWWNEYKKP